ncbi:hypothetical protein SARC_03511 [Sphaeroforma arctica JP610]|uniref:THO complex subunit 2 n=1 Tax=Sphaeroforma arctica JP610 TaxID=667725 RepID=A0A0L0G7Q8_9EUKA|nr:hypothetical protein SARC_03511 [Sphaeroforma arctica JP610]KNC84263.1 hypothetical protein SARC_03511 [Sphaeroforma arctica JP610]|eukprot:XP_014158165.1 hypothetical protein SARC_03511 [Sphaeroforma arctica JP610]
MIPSQVNFTTALAAAFKSKNDDATALLEERLLDVIWTLDHHLAPDDDQETFSEQRTRLVSVVSDLKDLGVLTESRMKSRLETGLLVKTGTVPNVVYFSKSIRIARTKMFYKQNKYNLCREVAEGYSRLVDELIPGVADGNVQKQAQVTVNNIHKIIGFFSLDPNRVVEVIFSCFEELVDDEAYSKFYLEIITVFNATKDTLTALLGFRFKSVQTAIAELVIDEKTPVPAEGLTPRNLYRIAALMVKHDLVDMIRLWDFLIPEDKSMVEVQKERRETMMKASAQILVIDLSRTGGDEDYNIEVAKRQDLDDYKRQTKRKDIIYYRNNQKLNFIHHMIVVQDMRSFSRLLTRVPLELLTSSPETIDALLKLLHVAIEPIYRPLQHSWMQKSMKNAHVAALYKGVVRLQKEGKGIAVCRKLTDLLDHVYPILARIGCHVYTDVLFITKLARLTKRVYEVYADSVDEKAKHDAEYVAPTQAEKDRLEALWTETRNILTRVVLSSMSLKPGNPGLNEEVYAVVSKLPYETRYTIYASWLDMYTVTPLLLQQKNWCIFEARRALKRLTKENPNETGRVLCKIAHSNPFTVFHEVMDKVSSYTNFIEPLIEGFSTLTDLDKDILTFCVIVHFRDTRKKRMEVMMPALKAISTFCGMLYNRMWATDFSSLLYYVAGQLSRNDVLDLGLLKALTEHMAGVESTDNLNEEQMECQCGGLRLRIEGGTWIKQDSSQLRLVGKPTVRLLEELSHTGLVMPLILLIEARKRDLLQLKEPAEKKRRINDEKTAADLYDICHDSLLQLIELLQRYLPDTEYDAIIPSFETLAVEHGLSMEVAFLLHRPRIAREIGKRLLILANGETNSTKLMVFNAQAFEEITEPYAALIEKQYPDQWEHITPRLYVSFWAMSQYDLKVPTAAYEKIIKKMKESLSDPFSDEIKKEYSQMARNKIKKVNKQRLDLLEKELKEHQTNQKLVLYRLRKELPKYFKDGCGQAGVDAYIQMCVNPRQRFGPIDALYCAEFTRLLHAQSAPNFATHAYLNQILADPKGTISSSTPNQAQRYSRFLWHTLKWMNHWTKDKGTFLKECSMSPGFKSLKSEGRVSFLEFQNQIYRLQSEVLANSFYDLINSPDRIDNRNALQVLQALCPQKLVPVFPVLASVGKKLSKLAGQHKEIDSLSATVTAYQGLIEYHERQKFYMTPEALGQPAKSSTSTDSSVKAQQNTSKTVKGKSAKSTTQTDSKTGAVTGSGSGVGKQQSSAAKQEGSTPKQQATSTKVQDIDTTRHMGESMAKGQQGSTAKTTGGGAKPTGTGGKAKANTDMQPTIKVQTPQPEPPTSQQNSGRQAQDERSPRQHQHTSNVSTTYSDDRKSGHRSPLLSAGGHDRGASTHERVSISHERGGRGSAMRDRDSGGRGEKRTYDSISGYADHPSGYSDLNTSRAGSMGRGPSATYDGDDDRYTERRGDSRARSRGPDRNDHRLDANGGGTHSYDDRGDRNRGSSRGRDRDRSTDRNNSAAPTKEQQQQHHHQQQRMNNNHNNNTHAGMGRGDGSDGGRKRDADAMGQGWDRSPKRSRRTPDNLLDNDGRPMRDRGGGGGGNRKDRLDMDRHDGRQGAPGSGHGNTRMVMNTGNEGGAGRGGFGNGTGGKRKDKDGRQKKRNKYND